MSDNSAGAAGSGKGDEQDVYQYEEQQERRAMLRSLHLPMKTWFNSLDENFRKKVTEAASSSTFPPFWQDLENWAPLKKVQKLYLAATESDPSGAGVDIWKLEEKLFSSSSSAFSNGNSDGNLLHGDAPKVKKRRSRWGAIEKQEDTPENSSSTTTEAAPRKRRSRFSAATNEGEEAPTGNAGLVEASKVAASLGIGSPSVSGSSLLPAQISAPVVTEEVMQQTMVLQMQLKNIGDRLMTVVKDAAALENDPNRPPSPPPKYDSKGIRTNTREVRMREELTQQRADVIEELLRINPLYQPPADYVRARPFKKIYIPYKENPNYNFIGIIIGPRGNTQKRMEQETGAKISIRGKGSVKDGSKGRSKQEGPDEDDELHVHVDGPTMEVVNRAVKLVEELLVVVEDDKNEHKQKQLRELALINGTLKEDEFCSVCAEKGHRHFECPQRTKSFKAAGVKCAVCGDQSHPTRDCPLRNDAPTNEVALDTEYMSFMAELGDGTDKSAGKSGDKSSDKSGDKSSEGVIEDEKYKISTTSSGKGVQQTVIHAKTVLTGASLPGASASASASTSALQYGQTAHSGAYGYSQWQYPYSYPTPSQPQQVQYDPSQPQAQPQQPQQVQYDAYGYPVYPSYAYSGYAYDPSTGGAGNTGVSYAEPSSCPPPAAASNDVNME